MLPGVGGSELIVIAIVALVVVGPKDLPKLLRQLGRFVGRMRAMADDFKASFDDMARQSELDDLRKEVEALRSTTALNDVKNEMRAIDSDIRDSVNRVDTPRQAEPVDARLNDPQMDGLPPKWDATVAPDGAPPSVSPELNPEIIVPTAAIKTPRARKAKATPEAPAATVPEPAPSPIKRTRKKAVS